MDNDEKGLIYSRGVTAGMIVAFEALLGTRLPPATYIRGAYTGPIPEPLQVWGRNALRDCKHLQAMLEEQEKENG